MALFYKLFVIAAVGTYAASGLLGWDFGTSERRPLPTSVRQSPGGNRSFHFWHTGFHGGK
jgi:hypothetical protein